MRFVHVIARLKEARDACQTRLDALDDMDRVIGTDKLWKPSDEAMIALIEACKDMEGKKIRKLSKRITGYEHRREFGG